MQCSSHITSDGFGMEAEITGKLLAHRIRPFEVPITYRARSRAAERKLPGGTGGSAVDPDPDPAVVLAATAIRPPFLACGRWPGQAR